MFKRLSVSYTSIKKGNTLYIIHCSTDQVDSDAGSYQVSDIDVYGVTSVLSYLCQAGKARRHAESKHQQRLQQFGCAADAGIKIHLQRYT